MANENIEFKVKGICASGMVLQRNKINCIHGSAKSQSKITMSFRGDSISAITDESGNWKIEFNPGDAGGPFEMILENGDAEIALSKITFTDIYVGEVWVNSGQSNAQLPMERQVFSYPEELELPANPWIRMITIPITWNLHEEQETVENPTWVGAAPDTIGQMSGTAYFFAKKLAQELNVPVGIINASQGGSPITAWMNKQSLQELNKTTYISELEKYEDDKNVLAKQNELAENSKEWFGELESKSKMPDLENTTSGDTPTDKVNTTTVGVNNSSALQDTTTDVANWSEVTIPGYIDIKSAGTCWIKKSFRLTVEQLSHCEQHKTWLWLGSIIDADVTYVNGVQVGSTPYSYPPRRYVVPNGTLKEGENIILVRLQVNSSKWKIRLFEEKPYFLFTDDVYVQPCISRNVERKICNSSSGNLTTAFQPNEKGVCIPLAGKWLIKDDVKLRDCPPGMFFEWVPTALYNSMLAPCFTHAVAGVLWYQGESNAGNPEEYKDLLLKMMDLWRAKFSYGAKDLPFVVIQLPSWSDGHGENHIDNSMRWAEFRQVQLDAVQTDKNSALAIAIDAGEWNDLHPEKKYTCGTRSALEALRLVYNRDDIATSPTASFVSYDNKKIGSRKSKKCIVKFECGSSSLIACKVLQDKKSVDLNTLAEDKIVYGFTALCKKFGKTNIVEVPAVLLDNNTVGVDLQNTIGRVVELRYLWSNSPAPINLYNKELLPVAPFRVGVK